MTLTEMWRWGDGDVYVWSVRGLGYPVDWDNLVTGLSCGLGYPVDWDKLGLGYPGDGIISLIGKIGSSGGWRRLVMVTTWGIHVICWNMNEHGYFLMFLLMVL